MRTPFTAVVAVLTALVLILAAQFGAFEPEEARMIPLHTVYATFNQEGLKAADEAVDNEDLAMALNAIGDGREEVVLCVGDDVVAAVKASIASFAMPKEPVPAVGGGSIATIWVAAHLGSDGSVPPAYRVRSVEVNRTTIRVAFAHEDSPVRSCDLRGYMIWAPVGRVAAGAYTLELFDVTADRVIATRPWHLNVY